MKKLYVCGRDLKDDEEKIRISDSDVWGMAEVCYFEDHLAILTVAKETLEWYRCNSRNGGDRAIEALAKIEEMEK